LLILDEPFTGLDPVNQILLKDILLELRQQNTAIIFSTHQMEQVEKMCDNICLINKGKPVLSGELHEIKKRYGTNSIHLEYDGDGEFLKYFDFIRRADVYQNYAELELTDISKSSELLASLNGKLSLRKFEIVEPSLNSIFINVVGGPIEIEQASEKPIPVSQIHQKLTDDLVMKDGRVRKALLSLIGMGIITFAFVGFNFTQTHPKLLPIGITFAGTVFSGVRFFQTKKKVRQEFIAKSSSEERL